MKEFLADMARQVWVLIGLFSAWLVLKGSARNAVGVAILAGLVIWMATHRIRIPRENNPNKKE
jgi:hypothetical protein